MWESQGCQEKAQREGQSNKRKKKVGTPESRKQAKEAAKGRKCPLMVVVVVVVVMMIMVMVTMAEPTVMTMAEPRKSLLCAILLCTSHQPNGADFILYSHVTDEKTKAHES